MTSLRLDVSRCGQDECSRKDLCLRYLDVGGCHRYVWDIRDPATCEDFIDAKPEKDKP